MLLDHASGAQRRASSVTVPTAREGESFAMGGSHLGLSEPHRLPALLRWRFFTLPPAAFASRACVSVRSTTARLISAESSLSGRFGAGALRPVGGEGARVTVFWRYAERGNDCAQRNAPLRVLLCRVRTGSSMHRFGKLLIAGFPLTRIIELRRGQPVGALAASFWRRERKAEPTTMRSVLLSMRQGPV